MSDDRATQLSKAYLSTYPTMMKSAAAPATTSSTTLKRSADPSEEIAAVPEPIKKKKPRVQKKKFNTAPSTEPKTLTAYQSFFRHNFEELKAEELLKNGGVKVFH